MKLNQLTSAAVVVLLLRFIVGCAATIHLARPGEKLDIELKPGPTAVDQRA